jgi:hypothetical protein
MTAFIIQVLDLVVGLSSRIISAMANSAFRGGGFLLSRQALSVCHPSIQAPPWARVKGWGALLAKGRDYLDYDKNNDDRHDPPLIENLIEDRVLKWGHFS